MFIAFISHLIRPLTASTSAFHVFSARRGRISTPR